MSPEEEKRRKSRETAIIFNNAFMISGFSAFGMFFFGISFGVFLFLISDEIYDKYKWLMPPILAFIIFGGMNFGSKVWRRYFEKGYIERLNKREDKRDEKRIAKEAAKKAKEEMKG